MIRSPQVEENRYITSFSTDTFTRKMAAECKQRVEKLHVLTDLDDIAALRKDLGYRLGFKMQEMQMFIEHKKSGAELLPSDKPLGVLLMHPHAYAVIEEAFETNRSLLVENFQQSLGSEANQTAIILSNAFVRSRIDMIDSSLITKAYMDLSERAHAKLSVDMSQMKQWEKMERPDRDLKALGSLQFLATEPGFVAYAAQKTELSKMVMNTLNDKYVILRMYDERDDGTIEKCRKILCHELI